MTPRAIELTEIKRDLANLPADKLAEVREFIRTLLRNIRPAPSNVESLEGIWEGLGWEQFGDLEGEVRKLRKESSEHLLNKCDRWSS